MAINYQVRDQQLEILINDLKLHMGVKTSLSHKFGRTSNVDFPKVLLVEKFLTSVMMNKRDIFINGKLTELGKKYEKLGLQYEGGDLGRSNFGAKSEILGIQMRLFFDSILEEIKILREEELAQLRRGYEFVREPKSNLIINEASFLESNLSSRHKEFLNKAITLFRQKLQSQATKLLISSTRQKAAKRFKAAEIHMDELLSRCGVLTCIALDLTFIHPIDANKKNVLSRGHPPIQLSRDLKVGELGFMISCQATSQQAQEYFTKLIRNGKNHQALKDLAGYFQKWEFSLSRGVYSRTIFVFPQEAVKDVDTLIESIANYWNDNITDGKGLVERAKLSKMPKQLLATVCTIKPNDKSLIEEFKQRVLLYLTHIDLYYQPPALKHFSNVFSRSEKKKPKLEEGESPRYS